METNRASPGLAVTFPNDSTIATQGGTPHSIFAAVDDSSRAPEVVATALALARAAHAKICLYQAVAVPPEFPPAAATHTIDVLPAYLHQEGVARLTAFARGASDLSCELLVEESQQAGLSILRAANRYGADLIVIGRHKLGIADLLGTTTGHVVRAAACNVLVTGAARANVFSKSASPERPFVLACLDHSPTGSTVLHAAVDSARVRGLEVRALRVVTGAGELCPSTEALIAQGVADLERVARDGSTALAGVSAIIDEAPWRAICSTANGRAALVVVGVRSSGPLLSLATTAAHLVRHCDAPILIVHLGRERSFEKAAAKGDAPCSKK